MYIDKGLGLMSGGTFFMKKLSLFALCLMLIPAISIAEDIYIAQTMQGVNNGANCSNAHSVSWFNTSSNWSNPKQAGKIGPGDTAHLCGTISTNLTIYGSGSYGLPIAVLFEDGAKFSAPTWASAVGAINCSSKNYITIDGGTNGIIEATDNGSPASFGGTYTYQNNILGIYINGCTNMEVKNLTMRNFYRRVPNSPDCTQAGKHIYAIHNFSGLKLHDLVLNYANVSMQISYDGGSVTGLEIYNNVWNDNRIAIQAGPAGNYTTTLESAKIYDNIITGGSVWGGEWAFPTGCGCTQCGDGHFHQDGMQSFTNGYAGVNVSNLEIFNNYLQDFGVYSTGHIYLENTHHNNAMVYNNILVNTGTNFASNGMLTLKKTDGVKVYNNTFVGAGPTVSNTAVFFNTAETYNTELRNNIVSGVANFVGWSYGNTWTSDYNVFYNGSSTPFHENAVSGQGGGFKSMTLWKSQGYDQNSVSVNPQLGLNYKLTSSSPVSVKAGGVNLSSSFTFDKAGISRPSVSKWSMGAYQAQIKMPLAPGSVR